MKENYTNIGILASIMLMSVFSCNPIHNADTIFINGKIITVDENFSIAEAVAIKGDKIIAVGSNDEIKKYAGSHTQVIDAEGRTIVPGLIDAHCHPESASLSELEEEIPDVHTIAGLMDWIKLQAVSKKDGEWIVFPKMFYTRLRDLRQPTLDELDQAAPNHPVFLNGSFGGMVNSAAMKASAITDETVHKGLIKDKGTGKLTGFIRASAFSLLKLPPAKKLTYQAKADALMAMFKKYNKYGITGIISGYGDFDNLKRYRDMEHNGELTVRVSQNFILPFDVNDSKEGLVDSLNTFNTVTGDGDEWVRTGGLKIFLDGGILTGTAYLREPWGSRARDIYDINDSSYRGVINYSYKELLAIVTAASESGWAFTAHCTGGGGVDLLLDVFEEVNKIKPIKESRFSIIHGNFYTREAISRMSKLGILANMQPAWFYKDADAMKYILGGERIKTFSPFRSMAKAGIVVCGGSDHMVKLDPNTSINPYNPFLAIWSMVTRTTERGNIIEPSEAISREDALKMYTINNAFATFEEAIKGSLEPGKLADLVILSNDLLRCPEDEIKNIYSELTMVGGKVVYASGKLSGDKNFTE
ncbi:MAG: amidohydrolase [Chlorobi bacterium]|nr:amidohydrolase [Chlorobiota bacterium]